MLPLAPLLVLAAPAVAIDWNAHPLNWMPNNTATGQPCWKSCRGFTRMAGVCNSYHDWEAPKCRDMWCSLKGVKDIFACDRCAVRTGQLNETLPDLYDRARNIIGSCERIGRTFEGSDAWLANDTSAIPPDDGDAGNATDLADAKTGHGNGSNHSNGTNANGTDAAAKDKAAAGSVGVSVLGASVVAGAAAWFVL